MEEGGRKVGGKQDEGGGSEDKRWKEGRRKARRRSRK
jgi:hypothetical protein